MCVALYQLVHDQESPKTVAFSEFIADVRGGHVERVEVKSHDNAGEYSYWATHGSGPTQERIHKVTYGLVGDSVNKELLDHEVRVTYAPDDQNGLLTSILVTWL